MNALELREAQRLLRWAEFNLTKGKVEAGLILVGKTLAILDREERDG